MKPKTKTESESLTPPASMVVMKTLSKEQKEKLNKLEAVVEKHFQSFFKVVAALRTIKAENLWQADYNSWEDYVERKWRRSRQHSYRLLDADEIIEKVKTVTQGDSFESRLPTSERPYRELKELLDKDAKAEEILKVLRKADTYTESTREIEPGDIRKAAVELKLVAKSKRVVFELKEEWGKIRDGLVDVVKVLEKHEDLAEQTTLLKDLLEKVREAVTRCPPPPKAPKPKTAGKAKAPKPVLPKPKQAKK